MPRVPAAPPTATRTAWSTKRTSACRCRRARCPIRPAPAARSTIETPTACSTSATSAPTSRRPRAPDPKRPGCPLDTDRDGVIDVEDQCPEEPRGLNPDPAREGCPLPDRDRDAIPDDGDACPDTPGAPDPDPRRHGCPGLVRITGCQIAVKEQVFFATNKDVILPRSFPVLRGMAIALRLSPQIKRVSIDGHTDAMGKLAANMDLSDRRARSVLVWLVNDGGISADRVESHGYGPTRPIADNRSAKGKALNRRVEFNIIDPVCGDPPMPAGAANPASPRKPEQIPAPEARTLIVSVIVT